MHISINRVHLSYMIIFVVSEHIKLSVLSSLSTMNMSKVIPNPALTATITRGKPKFKGENEPFLPQNGYCIIYFIITIAELTPCNYERDGHIISNIRCKHLDQFQTDIECFQCCPQEIGKQKILQNS